MSLAEALDRFKARLKPKVRIEVLLCQPKDVNEAMEIARIVNGAMATITPEIAAPRQPYYGCMPMEFDNL